MNTKYSHCEKAITHTHDNLESAENDKKGANSKEVHRLLGLFIDNEEKQNAKRVLQQLIQLEGLGLILYYTADKQWWWFWVFVLCVFVFTLFQWHFFRLFYILGLSVGLAYILSFKVLDLDTGKWWCAVFVFLLSFIVHSAALIKDKKTSDLIV